MPIDVILYFITLGIVFSCCGYGAIRTLLGRAAWSPFLKKLIWGVLLFDLLLVLLGYSSNGWRFLVAFGIGAVGAAMVFVARAYGREDVIDSRNRGASLAEAKEVARLAKSSKHPSIPLVIGGVPIPFDKEPYHLLVAGATGTGKSVVINTVLDTLRERGDTVLIVDSGGDFLRRHFNPKRDHIINPFDARCAKWSPLLEMSGPWDAAALARSIIPDGSGDASEWNSYAQTFVTAVLSVLFEAGNPTLREFLYLVQAAPLDEVARRLSGTPAAAQLTSERTFGSIRTIAANYTGPFNYLSDEASTFSISQFIQKANGGFTYLTYRDDQLDSTRNLIACILDIAARTVLSLPPSDTRRIWLVIDEFASIGKVQSIESFATKARKAGGCLLVGLQQTSQMNDRYGSDKAVTIMGNLSTWLTLRCTDGDTAEFMSKYIGEQEVLRKTGGSSDSQTGTSHSTNVTKAQERVVLPSQLQQLPNLHGYLKLAGDFPICRVKLALPEKKESPIEGFKVRDFMQVPMMKLVPTLNETPRQNEAPAHVVVNRPMNASERLAMLMEEFERESSRINPDTGVMEVLLDRLKGLRKELGLPPITM